MRVCLVQNTPSPLAQKIPTVGIGHRCDERPLQCTGAAPERPGCPWPRRGRGQGDERCGHHGAGYSANEEAEGLPADHGPGEQTGLPLVDLPDLLPASAATLLRDVTVEEAVSLFHKFVGENLTEDLVVRILEAYVPMKIQIRQEEVWASQFQRNKACIGN